MPIAQVNLGWYDQNEGRQFPLSDDAGAVDGQTGTRVPDNLLVDLVLIVPQTIDPSTVFLSSVAGFGSGVVISFTADDEVVAVATVPSSHTRFDSYAVTAVNSSTVTGRVAVGHPDVVSQLSDQRLNLDLDNGRLASVCVRPRLQGIAKLTVRDFAGNEHEITDDMTLAGGNHVDVSVDNGTETLTIDVVGDLVIDDRFSGNTDETGRVPIKSVNGVVPDANGNITLEGTDCLRLSAGVNRLVFSDTCAEPCCGCEELDRVTAGFDNIGDGQSDLRSLLNAMNNRMTTLEQNFLRSNIP